MHTRQKITYFLRDVKVGKEGIPVFLWCGTVGAGIHVRMKQDKYNNIYSLIYQGLQMLLSDTGAFLDVRDWEE